MLLLVSTSTSFPSQAVFSPPSQSLSHSQLLCWLGSFSLPHLCARLCPPLAPFLPCPAFCPPFLLLCCSVGMPGAGCNFCSILLTQVRGAPAGRPGDKNECEGFADVAWPGPVPITAHASPARRTVPYQSGAPHRPVTETPHHSQTSETPLNHLHPPAQTHKQRARDAL